MICELKIKPLSPYFRSPKFFSEGSSGLDLFAGIEKEISFHPGNRCLIPLGFAIEIPRGYEAQIRPRSGLALNHGITLLNSPGTIDHDYRGEIQILLIHLGKKEYLIQPEERIAQLVIQSIPQVQIQIVSSLKTSKRGESGFGSTGKF